MAEFYWRIGLFINIYFSFTSHTTTELCRLYGKTLKDTKEKQEHFWNDMEFMKYLELRIDSTVLACFR
jgi:hypothetical protein